VDRLYPLLTLCCILLLYGTACQREKSRTSGPGPDLIWSYHLGSARDLTADYIGDGILIASSSGSLDWVDVRTGSARYSVSDPNMYNNGLMWFASPDGQVYYMLRGGYTSYTPGGGPPPEILNCRDSAGRLQWQIRMPPGEYLSSTAIAADRIFIILDSGNVMAVSRAGEMLWFRDLQAERLTGFAAFVSRQLVYIDKAGYLAVADMQGDLIWKSANPMGFYSSTLELEDGSLALYDYPLALRYFDEQGQLLWRADFAEYGPDQDGMQGGSLVSQFNVDRMLDALPGNGCAVAHPDGRISAFSADGRLLWRSAATGSAQLICSDERGNVYGSVRGGSLYAYDSQGRLAWKEDSLGQLNSAPSTDGLGQIYIESDSTLFCLRPRIPEIR